MTPLHAQAVAAFRGGDPEAALALFERAAELEIPTAALLNDHGCCLTALERIADAQPIFAQAVALDPTHADAWHNLGVALAELGEQLPAFDAIKTALKLDRTRARSMKALGRLLLADHQPEPAKHLFQTAAAVDPTNAEAKALLAGALVDLGDERAARAAFAEAAALSPDDADAQFALGDLLDDCGERDAAEAAYRRAIALRPDLGMALGRLLTLLGERADSTLVRTARDVLEDPATTPAARAHIGYGLARALDRAGDPDGAFLAAAAANAARRGVAGPYDRAAASNRVDRLIETFTPELMAHWQGRGDPSELPVFIVGLPRSGTTLTERIIAAHPLAEGVGERPEVARAATTMPAVLGVDLPWPACMAAMTDAVLHETARDMLAPLERAAKTGTRRVVDKQPLNLFHVGLIALALPNARIVHCLRDPRDVLTSIYFQDFTASQTYATDLVDLAHFALETARLMAHWKVLLPERIYTLRYEELAAAPENEARELLRGLDLPWAKEVLRFYDRQAMVRTPSRWQVRKTVNADAVGRWKRYGEHLNPMLRTLARSHSF